MSCDKVQERLSSFVDRRITDAEREDVLAHIESCSECSAHLESLDHLRTALGRMNTAPLPAGLTGKLMVLASHERERRMARMSISARLRDWSDRLSLTFNNLMRPLAFPFAGGLLSSLLVFGVLVPTLTFQHALADQMFFTYPEGDVVALAPSGTISVPESENPPRIERLDASIPEAANVVDLTIDPSGRVSDWNVVRGELTPDLINIIMLGQFSPATNMGVPILGKVRAFQIRSVQTAPIRVRS